MTAVAVVDLGFGDAGKGALVDRLCARGDVDMVVRWNGGCQAAHNVVQTDGRHHTFAQFGSGTFHEVPTYLAEPVMVEPLSMMIEAAALSKITGFDYSVIDLMTVHPDCRVTTPYHWLVNRWQEDQRGDGRHGSCGRGIGMTAWYALAHPDDAVHVRDIDNTTELRRKLALLAQWASRVTGGAVFDQLPDFDILVEDYQFWYNLVKITNSIDHTDGHLVFEGAQGVLLDEHFGLHPHTTWSTVTPNWVREYCATNDIDLHVMGVTRAYSTRHGAGPMVTEDETLDLPEAHNKREHYQGEWRVGHLDVPALQYAIRACQGIDSVYVSHVDTAHSEPNLQVCTRYNIDKPYLPFLSEDYLSRERQSTRLSKAFPILQRRPTVGWGESVSDLLEVPLAGIGFGPRTSDGTFATPVLADNHMVP